VGLAVLAAAPLIALVEREPALGVMLVLVFTLAGMVVLSGIRLYWVLGLLAAVTGAVYGVAKLHVLKGYQLTRLTAFLHPQQNLAGAGYNGLQAKIAIGSGGLYGHGLFHGTFTGGSFVPSVQTDFIFTVAGEELASSAAAVLVALLSLIVFRAIRAAQLADDMFGLLVASGIAIWFAFQFFVNIGMTIGIMPITGLPLPFRLLRRLSHLRRHDRHRPPQLRPPPPPPPPNPRAGVSWSGHGGLCSGGALGLVIVGKAQLGNTRLFRANACLPAGCLPQEGAPNVQVRGS